MAYTEPNVPVALTNVLMQAVVDRLSQVLITDAMDDAKAGLVRAGKLQEDPTSAKIILLISPADEDWPNTLGDMGNTADNFLPYEIGGGLPGRSFQGSVFYRRRMYVSLKLFFDNETYRMRAQLRANAVLHRALWALWTMDIPYEPDAFGETAQRIQVCDHYIREAGGEGTFIWRGVIKLEFQTHYTPA